MSLYSDLQSCMICVARRIIAVERTERFSTRHELSGKFMLFTIDASTFPRVLIVNTCDICVCKAHQLTKTVVKLGYVLNAV